MGLVLVTDRNQPLDCDWSADGVTSHGRRALSVSPTSKITERIG